MTNKDIREKAKLYNIKLWQIADKLGIADSNFSKILRKELNTEKKNEIYNIIEILRQEDNENDR